MADINARQPDEGNEAGLTRSKLGLLWGGMGKGWERRT